MGLIGIVSPIVNEGAADGIVADGWYCVDSEFHSNESAHFKVVTFEFVGEHLAGQKRRVFVVLIQVGFHTAVDLEICFLPLLPCTVLMDERAVEQFVVEVERNNAVVAIDGGVVADVAVVDIACVERGSQSKVVMPAALSVCAYRNEDQ